MLEELKQSVFDANMLLPHYGLVTFTWGNVSGIDREAGLFVIKPSGVPYEGMQVKDMVVVDMAGKVVEGAYKPSSDMPTHLVLYQNYPEIGGIVHTHSTYAASWAQANRDIPAYGTTHADYMYGDVPCARRLTEEEVKHGYETETGNVIVETFTERKLQPLEVPAVIISNHGPFTWGKDAMDAVHNAVVLEEVARMAMITERIRPDAAHIDQYQLDKHYLRKHGANAYYGQTKKMQQRGGTDGL